MLEQWAQRHGLASFDGAITHGVNFISVTIAGPTQEVSVSSSGYWSISCFRKSEIPTSCSAGNDGP